MNGRVPEATHDGAPGDGVSHPVWGALYEEVGERVYHLILRMTGDPELAADVTHDAFVRVYERQAQFDGRGSLKNWVYAIAKNIARDRFRRRRFRAGVLADRADDLRVHSQPGASAELQVVLGEAVESLSEEHRTVLMLHDVDGYSHEEIAEMLDLAVGSSRARLSRARARLRGLLDHTL